MNFRYRDITLAERPATAEDEAWLWALYATLLKPSIDRQWGWDEAFQRENFSRHLPYTRFTILLADAENIAAYAAETEKTRIYLHMLLVAFAHQSHGVGRHVLDMLKTRAVAMNLPIELSVMHANPASAFYQKNGFELVKSMDGSSLFRWIAA